GAIGFLFEMGDAARGIERHDATALRPGGLKQPHRKNSRMSHVEGREGTQVGAHQVVAVEHIKILIGPHKLTIRGNRPGASQKYLFMVQMNPQACRLLLNPRLYHLSQMMSVHQDFFDPQTFANVEPDPEEWRTPDRHQTLGNTIGQWLKTCSESRDKQESLFHAIFHSTSGSCHGSLQLGREYPTHPTTVAPVEKRIIINDLGTSEVKMKRHLFQPDLFQSLSNTGLLVSFAIEQQKPSSASSGYFPPQCAACFRGLVNLVDARVGDFFRNGLLNVPTRVQERAKTGKVTRKQGVFHLGDQSLECGQS